MNYTLNANDRPNPIHIIKNNYCHKNRIYLPMISKEDVFGGLRSVFLSVGEFQKR